jgi:branched-subunit amino acid ABC-type transport system permease component
MMSWVIYILVHGGVAAATSVGLGLHLRLVRFFDLTWALWTISAALIGVQTTLWTSSAPLGVLIGAITGAILGILEDGFLLRDILTSHVSSTIAERFLFCGALAAYLGVISLIEVAGLRDRVSVPPSQFSWLGLSSLQLTVAGVCWGLLAIYGLLRISKVSLPLRAILANSRACPGFGMHVPMLAGTIGSLSGFLTGAGASSFALLYFANVSTGFSLMLLAIVPFILAGTNGSVWVCAAAVLTITAIAAIRFYLGDTAAEFIVQMTIIALLLARPEGVVQTRLRGI